MPKLPKAEEDAPNQRGLRLGGVARRSFYKSMTTYADHRVWQDVYHATTPVGCVAYIKLTQVNDRPVVQFKER